jgi:hypothetical protein
MLGVRVLGPRLSFTVIKMQAVMNFCAKPHFDTKTSFIAAIILSENVLSLIPEGFFGLLHFFAIRLCVFFL